MISHNLSFLEWSEHRFQGKMTLTHGLEPNAAAKTDFQPKRRQVEYHNSGLKEPYVRRPKRLRPSLTPDHAECQCTLGLSSTLKWLKWLTDSKNSWFPGKFFLRIIINIKKLNRNLKQKGGSGLKLFDGATRGGRVCYRWSGMAFTYQASRSVFLERRRRDHFFAGSENQLGACESYHFMRRREFLTLVSCWFSCYHDSRSNLCPECV